MITIRGDYVIISLHSRDATDSDRLLSNVEVQESCDFPLLVGTKRPLLESSDSDHFPVESNQLFVRQFGVGGSFGFFGEICLCRLGSRRFLWCGGFGHDLSFF